MAANYKELFMRYMRAQDINFRESGDYTVTIPYRADNAGHQDINVRFDKDGGNTVWFWCSYASMKRQDKRNACILTCNELNQKFRWVRFYLDEDNDLMAEADALVYRDTCGEECLKLVSRMVNIIDEAYPLVMKVMWL